MLTGDAVAIAKETCKALSLGTNVFDSERLIGSGMSGTEVNDFVEAADGFAEVFPEHKYQVRHNSFFRWANSCLKCSLGRRYPPEAGPLDCYDR